MFSFFEGGIVRETAKSVLMPFVTIACLLAVWEACVSAFGVPAHLLPKPSSVFAEFYANASLLMFHAAATTSIILSGFVLSVVVGIPLALAVSFSAFFKKTLYPIIIFSQLIPKIAIAPIFIIWFGFGTTPKVLLTFLVAFFPIVIDSIVGFLSIRTEQLRVARSMGASSWKLFFKVRLPQALPNIFAGLKMAMAMSSTGAIVAEFVASSEGLGYLLLVANGELKTALAFACLFLLIFIGIVLFFAVEAVERATTGWHVSQRMHTAT